MPSKTILADSAAPPAAATPMEFMAHKSNESVGSYLLRERITGKMFSFGREVKAMLELRLREERDMLPVSYRVIFVSGEPELRGIVAA